MYKITFISTIHTEIGKCNSDELYKIIDKLSPEVIFLEAVDETYSEYEKHLFATWGVYHKKLEIAAIQKYCRNNSFVYVPVCEISMSDAFRRKLKIVCQNRELQTMIDKFNSLAAEHGFGFLNSIQSISLQEGMRVLESQILEGTDLDKIVRADIDAYENPMIRNIYSYSAENRFSSAVFMCGVAHRKSIIGKIEKSGAKAQVNLDWSIYS